MENNVNKKKYLYILGSLILVIALFGVTYAWFNYRSETGEQEIVAGEIYLHLNEGQEEIELTNIFPETAAEARARSDNYLTFSVDGKNTSNKTIYYEIILDHGAEKNSPKSRYRDEDLRFDLVEINGNNETYLLSAASFETLVNRRIYVDTIDASTTSEIERHYLLRMWLDENVVISDTAEDKTYTTTEYPNKYATIKLIVAGDFQEKNASKSLYTIMKEKTVMDNASSTYVSASTGIDFGNVSSDTNGKGVYTRAGTENDTYPIMYYRGEVEDNNVIFNNFCWKAVRTTDTGGIKLIYNGEKQILYNGEFTDPATYASEHERDIFSFDNTESTWDYDVNDGKNHEISFKVPAGDNYDMVVTGTTGSLCGLSIGLYKDGTLLSDNSGGGGSPINITQTYGTLTNSNIIKVLVHGAGSTSSSCSINLKIKMQQSSTNLSRNDYLLLVEKASGSYKCDNTNVGTLIIVSGNDTVEFNSHNYSPAYAGYMYGDVYTSSSSNWTSGARFGSSFTWDGTTYKLIDATVTTPDATHHYSCNLIDVDGICANLRYVYYVNGSTKYYITLTGGDGVEEALAKMNTNTNDSYAKNVIDTWYSSNMNTITSKLEDTIWCNDRSFGDHNNNGWISNGGSLSTHLYYGAYQRSNSATSASTVKNQPSLTCGNKNDAFTWKNNKGNGALDYPVGMVTEDEIVLAGGVSQSTNGLFYLSSGRSYWSMSPSSFFNSQAREFYMHDIGTLSDYGVDYYNGLRPSVSLKSGSALVTSGSGTVTDPYVIE